MKLRTKVPLTKMLSSHRITIQSSNTNAGEVIKFILRYNLMYLILYYTTEIQLLFHAALCSEFVIPNKSYQVTLGDPICNEGWFVGIVLWTLTTYPLSWWQIGWIQRGNACCFVLLLVRDQSFIHFRPFCIINHVDSIQILSSRVGLSYLRWGRICWNCFVYVAYVPIVRVADLLDIDLERKSIYISSCTWQADRISPSIGHQVYSKRILSSWVGLSYLRWGMVG